MTYDKLFIAEHYLDQAEELFSEPVEFLMVEGAEENSLSLSVDGKTAVVAISGVLIPEDMLFSAGLVSFQRTAEAVEQAAEIEGVENIVLSIDSPGGTVLGSVEAANRISAVAKDINMVAHTSMGAFSAGFMLAAATGEVHVTDTSSVGSIGVRMTHINESKALEGIGLEVTELAIGKKKTQGSSLKALSAADKTDIMSDLQESFDMFVGVVHDGIGMSREAIKATEAGIFMGKSAVKAGLAKSVISLDQLISDLNGTDSGSSGSNSNTQNTQTKEDGMTEETNPEDIQASAETAPTQESEDTGKEQYLMDVMSELTKLERLDAMPGIVEANVAITDIKAYLSYEEDVKSLCTLSGEDNSEQFIEAGLPISEVKSALFDRMVAVAEATHVDSHSADTSGQQTVPKEMSVSDIYASRSKSIGKYKTRG